jgi:hypothetical protein
VPDIFHDFIIVAKKPSLSVPDLKALVCLIALITRSIIVHSAQRIALIAQSSRSPLRKIRLSARFGKLRLRRDEIRIR